MDTDCKYCLNFDYLVAEKPEHMHAYPAATDAARAVSGR